MVAFTTVLSTTLTLLLAATHVAANPAPSDILHQLLTRQISPIDTSGVPAECKASCDAVSSGLSGCSTVDCICKDSNIDAIDKCFNCGVNIKGSDLDAKTAQGVANQLTDACKAAGTPVKTANIVKNSALRTGAMGSGAFAIVALGAILALA